MKRTLLICLLFSLLLAPLQVQSGGWNFLRKKPTNIAGKSNTFRGLSRTQVSHILEKRLKRSFGQARKLQAQLPVTYSSSFFGEPVARVRGTRGEIFKGKIYKDKPFLTTHRQTAHYMAAQSNRLFVREVPRLLAWIEKLEEHLPQIEESVIPLPKIDHPIEWLTHQIPAQTTTLFVGEMHGFTEIHEAVGTLLHTLREQNPSREIILFTEFLPENFHWKVNTPAQELHLPQFSSVWEEAESCQMEIIGLEPEFSLSDSFEVESYSDKGHTKHLPQWAHLEGVRLRNTAWVKTLRDYRAQHPDALFVVYSGAAHSSYYFPFSLPGLLGEETSFVVTLYPEQVLKLEGKWIGQVTSTPYEEPLETLTKHILFKQPVLQFKDPKIAQSVGFDVRIKLPIDIERHLEENGF